MEPRRDDGDDAPVGRVAWTMIAEPQWSPVVTTGTTGAMLTSAQARDAAMEPRRDDGDDLIRSHDHGHADRAAMEPRRDDGDDDLGLIEYLDVDLPQWSPVVTTGTTSPPPWFCADR